ncbi:MAG: peptide deformylase [Chloroflexi bacterium]|nr:peptide deformylase [Chloroflexota bacterium]
MTAKPIITVENPVLREKSKKVSQFGAGLQQLVQDMWDSLHAAGGLGLAAPQIGVLQRVVVIEMPAEQDEDGTEIEPLRRYAIVNPEIVKMRGEEEVSEGCLSVPGYRGMVVRATDVVVKAQDVHGKPLRLRGSDLLAQAFQHEIDHLHGVLYLDRLASPDKLWTIEPGTEEDEE